MQPRPFDMTQQLLALALQQLDALVDERSVLHERIALLERAAEEARRFAHCDDVTGIPNRRLLEDRFTQAKARSEREGNHMAILFLDIDGFKRINDSYGHGVGDTLLRQIAARLVGCIRISDTACRYGGDEFVVLLAEHDGRRGAISALRNIREQLTAPYVVGVAAIELPASIGMAVYPTDGTKLGELIEVADSAMYREKASKREYAQCHQPQRRADFSCGGVDGEEARREQTRTSKDTESSVYRAPEEDTFTSEGAPPPVTTPRLAPQTRNSE